MAIFLKIVILNDDKKKRILTILEKSGPKLSLETIEFIDFCVDISIKKWKKSNDFSKKSRCARL